MSKSNLRVLWLVVIGGFLWGNILAWAQDEQSDDADDAQTQDDEDMEIISVVGVRNPNRALEDSAVPVDVITASSLTENMGGTDLLNQVANQVPSFNIEAFPIADAATIMRPPNMRGLASDNTLILVNGKRRHRGAVIALLGGGKNEGSHGVDISAIPSIALDRIEVLRDGASAQYGSDAIAGVMNLVLVSDPNARYGQVMGSQTLDGDGTTLDVSGIYGLPLGNNGGWLTISGNYNFVEPTVRSVQRTDATALIRAGNSHVRQPFAQIWGTPEIHSDFKIFANAEMIADNGMTMYGWGNVSMRDVEGGFFFRNPATRSGVFTIDDGQTALIADLGDDDHDCPTVPIANQMTPDPDALALVNADPNCYSFLSLFPGGFTPMFGGEVQDMSFAIGLKGSVIGNWEFDTSFVYGSSTVTYYMNNTINPQLVAMRDNVPTSYKPGEHQEMDWTFDYSMQKNLTVASGASDIHFATGIVVRSESFVTERGEQNSWFRDPDIAAQGFGIGSNGFPGFPPSSEVDESRLSYALWVDTEQDLTSNIMATMATRYEEFDDFGSSLDIKAATRIRYTDNVMVRAGMGTAYSAPTVGQANIRVVSTNFLASDICPVPGLPCLTDEVTIPPTDPIAEIFGGERLQPVRSTNVFFGALFVYLDADITLDYFRIDVIDRLARTSSINLTPAIFNELERRGEVIDRSLRSVRFYTNDFDTRTEGIELTANRSVSIRQNPTDVTLTASWVTTTVENYNPALINDQRVRELEKGTPKLRVNVNAVHPFTENLVMNGRLRYYHKIWEPHLFSDAFPLNVSESYLVDVEFQYQLDASMSFTFGIENLLDETPTGNHWAGVAGSKYPTTSPFSFNGGVAYFRAIFSM